MKNKKTKYTKIKGFINGTPPCDGSAYEKYIWRRDFVRTEYFKGFKSKRWCQNYVDEQKLFFAEAEQVIDIDNATTGGVVRYFHLLNPD